MWAFQLGREMDLTRVRGMELGFGATAEGRRAGPAAYARAESKGERAGPRERVREQARLG